jgi:hypothetical protein
MNPFLRNAVISKGVLVLWDVPEILKMTTWTLTA